MGKRKTKRKAPPRRQLQKLDKEFNCPICFADKAVEVHLNQKAGAASTLCRACRHTFETSITPIDAEIDVYAAWVDAVEDGTAGNGTQQTMLAEDLAAIPQPNSRPNRKLPRGPTNKRQRVDEHELDDEGDSERYQGEEDSEEYDEAYGFPMQQSRPVAAAKPVAAEDEIELPDEEEEYDFGDNNDDDDDVDDDEDEDRNHPANPANEEEPEGEAAAPDWDQDEV